MDKDDLKREIGGFIQIEKAKIPPSEALKVPYHAQFTSQVFSNTDLRLDPVSERR